LLRLDLATAGMGRMVLLSSKLSLPIKKPPEHQSSLMFPASNQLVDSDE
jgi:hypothetical protein